MPGCPPEPAANPGFTRGDYGFGLSAQRALEPGVLVHHGLGMEYAIGARVAAQGDGPALPGTFRDIEKLPVQYAL